MNLEAAKILIDCYIRGGFDALEALLGTPFTFEHAEPVEASDELYTELLGEYPVCMRAKIEGGGTGAMLLSMADAAKLVALVEGDESGAKTTLDDADSATFQEIAAAVMGGGVAVIGEKFEENLLLDGSETTWTADAADLGAYIGSPATAVRFTFKADPHFDAQAAIVYSQDLEPRVPGLADEDSVDISNEEVQDILGNFSPEDEPDRSADGITGNLDVIMDIELEATARLGKVEVPIAEILTLGPGSIIEVGHLVDEPVELLVNDKLIARGDVVVVDEKFGLRITEVISPKERIESLR